jgi:hypothetical protein
MAMIVITGVVLIWMSKPELNDEADPDLRVAASAGDASV